MTDEERMPVAIVRLRLAGVHPSWIDWAMRRMTCPLATMEAWDEVMHKDTELGRALMKSLRTPVTGTVW
jgi:hypothetical protein